MLRCIVVNALGNEDRRQKDLCRTLYQGLKFIRLFRDYLFWLNAVVGGVDRQRLELAASLNLFLLKIFVSKFLTILVVSFNLL